MPDALRLQFLRYAGVGSIAAASHYATLIFLVEVETVDPVLGAVVGFMVGGIVSYILNRRFTFSTYRDHRDAVPRFTLIAFVAFLMTGGLMHVLHEMLGLHYFLAQLIITAIVMIWTFAANRFWTFADAT